MVPPHQKLVQKATMVSGTECLKNSGGPRWLHHLYPQSSKGWPMPSENGKRTWIVTEQSQGNPLHWWLSEVKYLSPLPQPSLKRETWKVNKSYPMLLGPRTASWEGATPLCPLKQVVQSAPAMKHWLLFRLNSMPPPGKLNKYGSRTQIAV